MEQLVNIDSQRVCFQMTRTSLIFHTLISRFCPYSTLHVIPCQNSTVRPQVADGGKVYAGQLTRSGPPALGFGWGANTFSR